MVATRRPASLAALAVTAMVAALAVPACSSGSSGSSGPPKPSPTASRDLVSERYSDAMALITQCALSQHVKSVVAEVRLADKGQPASMQLVRGGRLVLTKSNYAYFNEWFNLHAAGLSAAGKQLGAWQQLAAATGKLPAAVCGAGISARQLHDQIFAQYPTALKNNPWVS